VSKSKISVSSPGIAAFESAGRFINALADAKTDTNDVSWLAKARTDSRPNGFKVANARRYVSCVMGRNG
jgi:hypothetical protein